MPDPSPSGASLWPENTQTVCVVDASDTSDGIVHRSTHCPHFPHNSFIRFTTTGLARKTGYIPCSCCLIRSEELP